MRLTKIALLVFGLGLLLGLVVVAAEIRALERVASGLMALGIAAIPFGMIADWGSAAKNTWCTPMRRAQTRTASRPRRSAPRKR
jgi:hypothetical protein